LYWILTIENQIIFHSEMKFISSKLPSFIFILFTAHLSFASVTYKHYLFDKNTHSKSNKALVLWEHYISNSIDSLRILGTNLYRVSEIEKSNYGKAIAQRLLGCYDVRTGKIDRGIRLLKASENYFLAKNDFEMICESMNEIGIAYFLKGDLETAESFFKASLKYGEESPVESNSYLAEVNLAKVYFEKNEVAKAEFLLNHYISKTIQENKFESASNAYSLLGEIALNLNRLKTAQRYFDKQLFYAKKSGNSTYISRALNNQAISAYYKNQSVKAISLFNEVLKRRKQEHFPFNTYDAYFNLARFYYPDQLDFSLKYIDSCFKIAKNHSLKKQELEVYEWRFEHFQDEHNKHLIDSMKVVILDLEKQNESARKKLLSQKIKNKSQGRRWQLWPMSVFASLSLLLGLRYFFIRKKHSKLDK
jgi:tetratricopeptide (TPR) repeat protein